MNEDNGVIEQIKKLLEQDQRESKAMRGAAEALPQQREQQPKIDLAKVEQSLARIEASLLKIAAAATRPPGVK